MKRINISLAAVIAAAVTLASCGKENGEKQVSISGHVAQINGYGQVIPDFTPADMAAAGFDYADLMDIKIGDDVTLHNVPYVSSFNEVAILGPSYVDYNAKGDDFGFAMLNGDFHYYIGGEVGQTVTMTLAGKGGYKETYELMKSVYATDRAPGEGAAEYANFRMVTTAGIAPGVLYRSSNPINCVKNAGRYRVADSLAAAVGINTEIDLADTPQDVEKYIAGEGYESTYCPRLYRDGRTIACGMMANSFCDDFKQRLGQAAKFMLAGEPPYLIHCNEGKDRCGFVTMVLEALCGADIEEIRRDYMVTMLNFYKIEDGGASYFMRQSLSIDRMVWLMCHEDALDNYKAIDWDNIDVSNIDWQGLGFYTADKTLQGANLQASARNYLMECGLTAEECDALRSRLSAL